MILEVVTVSVSLIVFVLGLSWSSRGPRTTRLLYQSLSVFSFSFGCHTVALMAEGLVVPGQMSVANETLILTGVALGLTTVALWAERLEKES